MIYFESFFITCYNIAEYIKIVTMTNRSYYKWSKLSSMDRQELSKVNVYQNYFLLFVAHIN